MARPLDRVLYKLHQRFDGNVEDHFSRIYPIPYLYRSDKDELWYYVKKTDTDLRASGDSTSYTKDFLRFLP